MSWNDYNDSVFLRDVVSDDWAELDSDALFDSLETVLPNADAEVLEGLGSVLSKLGPVIQRALPGVVQGAVSGGSVAGPWGALVGGLAGGGLSALGGQSGATPTPTKPVTAPGTTGVSPTGNAAALQLASILYRPEVLGALLSAGLGAKGNQKIPVGKTTAPPSAFLNLLQVLAAAAASGAPTAKTAKFPEYLVDGVGNPVCDVASAEERAATLLAHLGEAAIVYDQSGLVEYDDLDDLDEYAYDIEHEDWT